MTSYEGLITTEETNDLARFVSFAFRLYKSDPNWVPPLRSDFMGALRGKDNKFLAESEHAFFMSRIGKRPVARVLVAVNQQLSRKQGMVVATFSLLEAEDEASMRTVMESAYSWAKTHGCRKMVGPWSHTNGEDQIGLMVEGFDDPPVVLNSYNKRWYAEALESFGFTKLTDFVGYRIVQSSLPMESLVRASDIAFRRAGVAPEHLRFDALEQGLKDIHTVMQSAFPEAWYNEMPSWEEFRKLAGPLSKLAYPDLVWLAKDIVTGAPVAFIVALPDWNQVLIKMKGRLLPFGWLHYLRHRRIIRRLRLMMQYCLKEYQGSSVIPALYAKVVEKAREHGIVEGEASVILESNVQSRRAIERLGGKLCRVYRWYSKDLVSE